MNKRKVLKCVVAGIIVWFACLGVISIFDSFYMVQIAMAAASASQNDQAPAKTAETIGDHIRTEFWDGDITELKFVEVLPCPIVGIGIGLPDKSQLTVKYCKQDFATDSVTYLLDSETKNSWDALSSEQQRLWRLAALHIRFADSQNDVRVMPWYECQWESSRLSL
ncbi:hypothetical protein [Bifidobacterium tibiigranuli]|jgi:hypothetical protein|uniref:hypothetical protein n=1 Tax=Bifidobacterium tibiigranuli TaxID=2172043 RepID=UPI0026EF94A0|nr:hypothetical protein [Bifidobacterium tibiigranuli]MCI2186687.1 hypothetical protein [Bifidobacterium tibiigranuli]MCI2204293.1 hypothetical protein [Bifidobacterium tibiigranuli]